MIRETLAIGEYYHIYNRGILKSKIFTDKYDRTRFLFNVLYFQSDIFFDQSRREVNALVGHPMSDISNRLKITRQISNSRNVSLIAFALMPNHFHLLLGNVKDAGVSKYMQRVLNSYTKYFNTRYQQNGHLFQGPYQLVHVEDNDQLLYLSAYIHKHRSIESSLTDYVGQNRWGKLLDRNIILGQFDSSVEYRNWLKDCVAKELDYLERY